MNSCLPAITAAFTDCKDFDHHYESLFLLQNWCSNKKLTVVERAVPA